jgi:hypothetical protein
MQKQHLHYFLLVSVCCLALSCGEPKFRSLNPYLHGKQDLNLTLPDTDLTGTLIYGWQILPVASLGSISGPLRFITPDGHLVRLDWFKPGEPNPIEFTNRIRQAQALTVSNSLLGLTCKIGLSNTGRSLTVELEGKSSTSLEARISIDIEGVKSRGLAAGLDTWTTEKDVTLISLPWGDQWKLQTDAKVEGMPKTSEFISASLHFENEKRRELTLEWSPLASNRGDRGLDIDTELMSVDQALALLIASIPPVHVLLPNGQTALKSAAEQSEAQWLVHAEFSPGYLNDLATAADQTYLLTAALPAYKTLYTWGPGEKNTILDSEPMLDASMSRFDTTSQQIKLGASLESRLREATVWTFAEQYLATDRPDVTKIYREQAMIALKDVRAELNRRLRLLQLQSKAVRNDTLEFEDKFLGNDSTKYISSEPFVAPDTLALLDIAADAGLSWLHAVSEDWTNVAQLPWPEELERLHWKFSQSNSNRLSKHWASAQNALLDSDHPGILPAELFRAPEPDNAAAEVSTVVKDYLGIRPRWRERLITFDPRLPEGWGRTRARIPFEQGELYVDYDLANKQAWIAARGLTQTYTCSFYMPTESGSLSQQFKLAPGDSPRKVMLVVKPGNKYRIEFESSDLPE